MIKIVTTAYLLTQLSFTLQPLLQFRFSSTIVPVVAKNAYCIYFFFLLIPCIMMSRSNSRTGQNLAKNTGPTIISAFTSNLRIYKGKFSNCIWNFVKPRYFHYLPCLISLMYYKRKYLFYFVSAETGIVPVAGFVVQPTFPDFVTDEFIHACILCAENNCWTQECSSICNTNCCTWLEFVER